MESIFTHDLILQYIYGEIDGISNQAFELELQKNAVLQQEVNELIEVVAALEKDDIASPTPSSIKHILNYSRKTALEESH